MTTGQSLFPADPPPIFDPATHTSSKKGFAEMIGVTPGRVSQLIAAGLPVEPNGRIHVARGRDWIDRNIDTNRRRAGGSLADGPANPVSGFLSPRAETG